MRLGVCTGVDTIAARPAGLDYIEPSVAALLCPDKPAEEAAAIYRRATVPPEAANCLIPASLKTTGPDSDPLAVLEYMKTVLVRAQAARLKVLVFGSGGSRKVPDGFDLDKARSQLVEHMKAWAPFAADAGVTIVLEPLNTAECNIVTSVDEGADLVRRVNHPSIRLLVDTYHMARDGDDVDAIGRAAGLIAHVHCAEGDGRGPLGAKGEDQRPYFAALKAVGYDARVSIEARWDDLPGQLPAALDELKRQIETA